jgi:aconitate hydratase
MAPEYGATCGIFPIDAETLRYLAFSGRTAEQVALVEAYAREQGLFHEAGTPEAEYSSVVDLDLATVEPSVAGPKRPQDRVSLYAAKKSFEDNVASLTKAKKPEKKLSSKTNIGFAPVGDAGPEVKNGSVVIAAITSCTNTSNPSVLVAAGLVAKKAVEKGLSTKPWVKTSLAPGSKVVTEYLAEAGLTPYLEKLKFHTVGYGCTTCIGNSGPLPQPVTNAIEERNLVVCSVLSGNRNFEGRVHPEVRANYLMSPPLVVAYALAGRIDLDLENEPLGEGTNGPVFLKDVWPSTKEVTDAMAAAVKPEQFKKSYDVVFEGDERWQKLDVPKGDTYVFEDDSTYIKHPTYFAGMTKTPGAVVEIKKARALAVLGDSITTDHISPAGSIKKDGPAGKYLIENGVDPKDFNSYGARRGNHELMVRGTFANVRLKNLLAPGTEGGVTRHLPDGAGMSIFDASVLYAKEGVPLIVLAGKEYGSGSSRDWAAKGPMLLGIRMVIAESYERIHRSNLVGMGILPLQFQAGENVASLGLTGEEVFETVGLPQMLDSGFAGGKTLVVKAASADGKVKEIKTLVRIDTPQEISYYQHGGILHYVLRSLAAV